MVLLKPFQLADLEALLRRFLGPAAGPRKNGKSNLAGVAEGKTAGETQA